MCPFSTTLDTPNCSVSMDFATITRATLFQRQNLLSWDCPTARRLISRISTSVLTAGCRIMAVQSLPVRLRHFSPDISRAAKLLIDKHGIPAAHYAKRRVEELLVSGHSEASELWRQIVAAIEELHRGGR
jgi:hypothetical protein